MIRISRIISLCILLMFLGFCAGMYLGSLLVPAGSGFTGSPIALGYGAAGIAIGLITGIILSRNLRNRLLRNTLIIVTIISLIVCTWIIYRVNLVSNRQSSTENLNYVHS